MPLKDVKLVRRVRDLARNSPWLLIAIGLHVILAATMSVLYIRRELAKANVARTDIAVTARAPEAVEAPLPEQPEVIRDKIPEDVRSELVEPKDVETFVPTEATVEDDPYATLDPFGTGEDGDDGLKSSTNIGVGKFGGQRGDGTTGIFKLRGHGGAGSKYGGGEHMGKPVATEKAVLEGLCWLARHQNDDGSWGAATLAQHCNPKAPCIAPGTELDSSYDVGMTALALLAFLGQGISPVSKVSLRDTAVGKRWEGGEVVKKGVRWLKQHQKPDGSFSDSRPFEYPENETLATMVLCEASALGRMRELRRPAQAALDFLVAAEKRGESGAPWGWGLGSRADIEMRHASGELDDDTYAAARANVDLSITCWVVMALKSAQTCGFTVPDSALEGALELARAEIGAPAAAPEPESARDDPFTRHAARTAALGMLVRSFVAQDIDDPYLETAAQEIAADVPRVTKDGRSVDFYYWYFATLALNQFDGPDSPRKGAGKYWNPWEHGLVDSLLELQDKERARDACSRGGWLQAARGNQKGLALYNTAMNVLTLEVYYRFANVFGSPAREVRKPH